MENMTSAQLAQMLYVAYYGRPADPAGLEFWSAQIDEVGVEGIAADFGTSAEFDARFGDLGSVALVNNLYQQLFGRDAEAEGLQYWLDVLAEGTPLASIAIEIANGAQGGDATGLQNKVTLAGQFTAAVAAGTVAYEGEAAATYGRDFLATINENTNVETYDVQAVVDAIESGELPVDTADLRQGLQDLDDAEAALVTFLEDSRANELLQENQAIDAESDTTAVDAAITAELAAGNAAMATATADANFATRSVTAQDALIASAVATAETNVADYEERIANVEGLAEAIAALNTANAAQVEAQEAADEAADVAGAEIASFEARNNGFTAVTEATDGNGDLVGYTANDGTSAVTILTVNATGQVAIAAGQEEVVGIEALRDALQADVTAQATLAAAQADVADAEADLVAVEEQEDFIAEFGTDTGADVAAELAGFEDALETLQEQVAQFENARDLDSQRTELTDAITAAEDNIADLGFDLQEFANGAVATEGNDVYLFADNTDVPVTVGSFGEEGVDRLFFGPDYQLVQLAEGETINDRVGSTSELEIFWNQGETGLELFVEADATAGNSTGTADITTITLTGVNAEDISFTSGFLSAGTATATEVA